MTFLESVFRILIVDHSINLFGKKTRLKYYIKRVFDKNRKSRYPVPLIVHSYMTTQSVDINEPGLFFPLYHWNRKRLQIALTYSSRLISGFRKSLININATIVVADPEFTQGERDEFHKLNFFWTGGRYKLMPKIIVVKIWSGDLNCCQR